MRQLFFLLLLIVPISLLSLSSGASTYLMVELLEEDLLQISSAEVFEDHLYYTDYFYSGSPYQTPFELVVYGSDDEVVYTKEVDSPRIVFNYSEDLSSLALRNNTTVLERIDLSFCNYNGICEPCLPTQDCLMGENTASCPDCPSGVRDNYCDLRDDGNCDPDCDGIDADCSACDPCYYEYHNRERLLCEEDLRGTPCLPGEGCLNGTYLYSDDEGTLCCTGTCLNRSATQTILSSDENNQEIVQQNQTTQQGSDDSDRLDSPFIMPLLVVAFIVSLAGIIGVLIHQRVLTNKPTTSDDTLQDRIVYLRLKGNTDTQIKEILRRQGYSSQDISRYLQ